MLALQIENYRNGNTYIGLYDVIRLLTPLKQEEDKQWLNEVSNTSLQIICRDLDKAYKSFFKGISRHPKFKCKGKAKLAFPVCSNRFYFNDDNTVQIQKIGKVKYKTDRLLPIGNTNNAFYNPRISYINNKWILTVSMECENQTLDNHIGRVGIDLCIKNLAVVSYFYNTPGGNDYSVYPNINRSKKVKRLMRKKIHYQRIMCRIRRTNKEWRNSNNYKRIKNKYRKVEYHTRNIRLNYIHQITHSIIMLGPRVITMEDLHIKNMLKNHKIAKSIQDNCWYMFRNIMEYKAKRYNIDFVLAPWWYPSTKYCCECHHKKKNISLSERVYKCKKCGLKIDRDLNAAINLQYYEPKK
jgi:putative transposase